MPDVFISYSRKDSDFVRRLHGGLSERGRDTWIDWEDIPATADWWKEIEGAIEATDAFIFIISPDSVRSEICHREIEHAVANHKRLVPILHKMTDENAHSGMHPSISTHNWLFFRDTDNFDKAFETLISALDTDLSHVRQHTRLLVRAREWENNGKNPSFLLQGDDLTGAEEWLTQGLAKRPSPLPLHVEYITDSREAATRRQRVLLAGVSVALVVATGLALLSFVLFGESNRQKGIAEEKSVTATVAQGQAIIEADNAQTQAAIAVAARGTSDANAVIAATQAAIALNNAATATIAQGEAQRQAAIAGTQAARAENNAATATNAQGEAQVQAALAVTQAAIALDNAATATIAQGEAQIQAYIAGTQAAIAQENAATATIAQGEALVQANIAGTQAAIAQENAATATYAQGEAEQQATAVADERNRAQSIALAGQAQLELENDQRDRGILIALHALGNYPYTWQAERALAFAVQDQLSRVRINGTQPYTSVDFSPDGTKLVTGNNDGLVRIYNVATGNELLTLLGHTNGVIRALWSPEGKRIASASNDNTARIWDATTGTLLFTLTGHTNNVLSIAWSPDGTKLASASQDGTAKLWDAVTGEELFTLSGHLVNRGVNNIEWSPDGTRVVTGSQDGTAKIWDVATGQEMFTLSGHTASVNRALWSPDGAWILTVSDDSTGKIWDATNGTEILTLAGHFRGIARAAWSPDGRRIATVSRDDTAKVWDSGSGELLLTLYGHANDVSGVAWSPDSRRLVTTSDDRTARVWDAEAGAQLLLLRGHTDFLYSVAWSPDGTHIATASPDNSARLWQIWSDPADLIQFARGCCITRKLTDEESQQFGIPPMQSDPLPRTIASCSDALQSRLYPGVRGRVSNEDNRALNVRLEPRLSAQQIGQISPDKTFWVTGERVCADGYAWFPVMFGINAATGWIAEGGDGSYFVLPILPPDP